MSLLFNLNKKGNILINKHAVQLCPELAYLTEEEMLFVVLSQDYSSPYKQLPENDRIRRSIHHAFGTTDAKPLEKEIIKIAIDRYRSLQYDPKRELIRTYKKKLNMLGRALEDEEQASAIKNIISTQKEIVKSIDALEEEISKNEQEEAQIEGGLKNSYLEKMMRNREMYKDVISNREKV